MFKRHQITLMSNPSCSQRVEDLETDDFRYYDKDGFELCQAEQKFYSAMKYPIDHNILNHHCWQEPWFELNKSSGDLILDHSMLLCRCNYSGEALEQLHEIKSTMPRADLLIRSRQKWGFDFDLDCKAKNGTIFEVLHIEYDSYDYDSFKERMITFDFAVRHTDWLDCASKIWNHRDQWEHLEGFAQNDWKARFLLGWSKAEYTQKSV